jgi:magnesium transporter
MTEQRRKSSKAGLPPGALVHVGEQNVGNATLSLLHYDTKSFKEEKAVDLDNFHFSGSNNWLNLDGVNDVESVSKLGKILGLDELLQEDILNTTHRPKFEEFDHHLFVTLKMIGIKRNRRDFVSEQVSFVMGKNWLTSFQEKKGDIFDGIRGRIEIKGSGIRQNGVDFLLYRLIDTVVDNYYFVTEYFTDELLRLEEQVLSNKKSDAPADLQRIRRKLVQFKKSVVPLREAVSMMQKSDSTLIAPNTQRFLIDVAEHIVQINESIDSHREMHASIMDLHYAAISNKTNQIMQVLTIIATIFIPLTFVAGIYGMNFKNMPELDHEYGYHIVWGVMILVAGVMVILFKRRNWF